MSQVSHNPLTKKEEEKLHATLQLILSHITNKKDMQSFLLSFLSHTEQLMLAKRLAIVVLIEEGYTDTEIATLLNTTRATVYKLRYYIAAKGEGYKIAFILLKNEKIKQEVKEAFKELGGYVARAAGGRVNPNPF